MQMTSRFPLCQYINEMNSWMHHNFLQLNKDNTEVITFGNKDEVLEMSSHVEAITKSTYYHIKKLCKD